MTEFLNNQEVRDALTLLAAKGALGSSPRRAKLLAYLLEEEKEGRGERITAYSIGVDVLGRPEDFDPNADAIVRAEIGRLRKGLEHYYATDGMLDPVKIIIPPRSNRPVIERKIAGSRSHRRQRPLRVAAIAAFCLAIGAFAYLYNATKQEPVALVPFEGPRIAVLEFATLGDDPEVALFAQGMRIDMVTELARFDWLSVFVNHQSDASQIQGGVEYALTGNVRGDGEQLTATLSLVRPETGELLWTHIYSEEIHAARLIAMQQEAATHIAVEIARPEGLIADLEKRRILRDTTDNDLAYSCIFLLYEFWRTIDESDHAALKECLEEALEITPNYAEAQAAMSVVFLEESRGLSIPASVDDPLERAKHHAQRALDLNPNSALAIQTAFELLALEDDLDEVRRIGEAAVHNAPNNPDLVARFGLVLSLQLGQLEEGRAYSERALAINPEPPVWYYYPTIIGAYMDGGVEEFQGIITESEERRPTITAAFVFGLAAREGKMDVAEEIYQELVPGVAPSLNELLSLVASASGFHETIIDRMKQDFDIFENARIAN